MPVKQLDVLVHPFYSFSDYDARREVWQKRIDAIAGNRHHYLAIELFQIDRDEAGDLIRYAKKKLGEQRVLVFQRSGLATYKTLARRVEALGYDRSKIKVNFYGETSTHCVLDAVKAFPPELVPKSRYRQVARVLLTNSVPYQTTKTHTIPELRNQVSLDVRNRINRTFKWLRMK